jgi:hypothetical protein
MTLLQFWRNPAARSCDVVEPEFSRLYCRKGKRYIPLPGQGWVWVDNLLQIANLTARHPQSGAFTRLLAKADRHLHCNVWVENVFNPGFAEALDRHGFIRVGLGTEGGSFPPCFLKMRE